MGYKRKIQVSQSEDQIQKALLAYNNQEFSSIRGAARYFEVDHKTLIRRMAGGKSRTQAREIQQILTTAEEKTLVR